MRSNASKSFCVCLMATAIGIASCRRTDVRASISSPAGAAPLVAKVESAYRSEWCDTKIGDEVLYFSTKERAGVYANLLKARRVSVLQDGQWVFSSGRISGLGVDDDLRPVVPLRSLGLSWLSYVPDFEPVDGAVYYYPLNNFFVFPEENSAKTAGASDWDGLAVNRKARAMIGMKGPSHAIPWSRRPRVAVLDTGVYSHDEFRQSGQPGTTLVHWYDTDRAACSGGDCCESGRELVGQAHGTQVAGLIAASDMDSVGIDGFGNVAELMSIYVPELKGGCFSESSLVAALKCATRLKADIVNISMQSEKGLPVPQDLYGFLTQAPAESVARGAHPLMVVAAGNKPCPLDNRECQVWPAAVEEPWVITVEALELSYARVSTSGFGKLVDLAAPGPTDGPLCSTMVAPFGPALTDSKGGYGAFSETSAATAVVTGAATRVLGHPNYDRCSPEQIRRVLRGYGKNVYNRLYGMCLLQVDFLYKTIKGSSGDFLDLCAGLDADPGCAGLREPWMRFSEEVDRIPDEPPTQAAGKCDFSH